MVNIEDDSRDGSTFDMLIVGVTVSLIVGLTG
jgi:hypothetical protein